MQSFSCYNKAISGLQIIFHFYFPSTKNYNISLDTGVFILPEETPRRCAAPTNEWKWSADCQSVNEREQTAHAPFTRETCQVLWSICSHAARSRNLTCLEFARLQYFSVWQGMHIYHNSGKLYGLSIWHKKLRGCTRICVVLLLLAGRKRPLPQLKS